MNNISTTRLKILTDDFGVTDASIHIERLSGRTRDFAAQALSGEFGRLMTTLEHRIPFCSFDKSPNLNYAEACLQVARHCPIIIYPDELLVGDAPLLEATRHQVPLLGGWSTSHVTINFARALREGYRGIRQDILRAQQDKCEKETDYYQAMLYCWQAAEIWQQRYLAEVQRLIENGTPEVRIHWQKVYDNLKPVPENPPTNFRQALQSLWMLFCFQRLMGNWSGIGRIDEMLGPFLENDLQSGIISLAEARELLAHFWIKGAAWTGVASLDSGDAQFYQNIVLGGINVNGDEVTNAVTYLVLDIVEELHISDFPVAVRLNQNSPELLLQRIAEIQRRGGGIVAIYNEQLIIETLTKSLNIPLEDARCFANDGCWEVLVEGKSSFSYYPFDLLRILQNSLGLGPDEIFTAEYSTFDKLYAAFFKRLSDKISQLQQNIDGVFSQHSPTPLISMLVTGCIENGLSYGAGGAQYNFRALHAGGLPDTANSLLAINSLVYQQKRFTLSELINRLRANWQSSDKSYQLDRQQIRSELTLYGNANEQADNMVRKVFDDYTALVAEIPFRNNCYRPAGISTFGREAADFFPARMAVAYGYSAEDILATNMSPTPGSDRLGPTAVIQSYCRMDYHRLPNGAPLELKIHPAALAGEEGLTALISLLKSFIRLSGWYLQIDVVDSKTLRDAQRNPQNYPNLCVRISGWSARFNTLAAEWQELVIQRTEQFLH